MKIKRLRAECEVDRAFGLMQIFLNNSSEVKYSRVRGMICALKLVRPKFSYCQQSKSYAEFRLKEYLSSKDANRVSTGSGKAGINDQMGHANAGTIDLKVRESGSESVSGGWSSSLVRTLALRAKGRRSESGSAHH
jgi:hypothetical protein